MQRFFHARQISEREFGVDDFDVINRRDLPRHMNHVVVFKAAHHMRGGIAFANVGEKLIAQTFAG